MRLQVALSTEGFQILPLPGFQPPFVMDLKIVPGPAAGAGEPVPLKYLEPPFVPVLRELALFIQSTDRLIDRFIRYFLTGRQG